MREAHDVFSRDIFTWVSSSYFKLWSVSRASNHCLQWRALTHWCTVQGVAHLISRSAALHREHDTWDRFIARLWALFSAALWNPGPLVRAGVMFMHEERPFDWAIAACTTSGSTAPTYQAGLIGDLHRHRRINPPYMALCYKNNCCSLVVKISAVSGPKWWDECFTAPGLGQFSKKTKHFRPESWWDVFQVKSGAVLICWLFGWTFPQ